ncbi:MAG TPA: helix-turn-helix domain-containing protein [Lapillicoccus sp.]|uniref:ArsR/SmtB family transcription factor n=1 Tax=Lapillicoccus sp. TaxID=1909287 RepID=UPI002F9365A6
MIPANSGVRTVRTSPSLASRPGRAPGTRAPIDWPCHRIPDIRTHVRVDVENRARRRRALWGQLAEPFAVSLPAISHHLKVLERAGLVVRTREAQWRPSRLQVDPLDEAVDWLLARRRTWDARMDRLEAHLRRTGEDD